MALSPRPFRQATISALLLVLALGLVNYLGQRYPWRWDTTAARLHSLSEQTTQLLAALRQDVRILAFYEDDHPAHQQVQSLLQAYAYESPRVRWQFVDPVREVARARHYQINEQGTLVIESGSRLAKLDGLADLGPSEEQLTNALIQVTRSHPQQVCMAEGHGEKPVEDTSPKGLWSLRRALEGEGYAVRPLMPLASPMEVECNVLVLAGPTADLAASEQQVLADYLVRGGRALILLGAGPTLALHTALSRWGIHVGAALILDPLATVFGADPVAPVITSYGAHESLKDFRLLTFFPWSRPVAPSEHPTPGIRTTPLLWSSPQSWAHPYQNGISPDEVNKGFVAGIDEKGPVALGVAVEADKTRLIVLGTAEIASNQYVHLFGHKNLLLNLVAWLAAQPDLIALKPRTAGSQVILLSAKQARAIFYGVVVAYPAATFIAGMGLWGWRRRQ
jgi:ABC-type uncharacterized transport system involved in gliding motility auxiliary subunit